MAFIVHNTGLTEYSDALRLQSDIRNRVIEGRAEDTLLLLEHPPTITIGKSGSLENVLVSDDQLAERDISLFFIDRGGDVTYHGPGQLVAYPVINLKKRGVNAHQYVHDLEEVVIRTLSDFSIESYRDEAHAGIWVENREIGAIGINLRRWVTTHGIALNVNIDLSPFSLINPCGFTDRKATSIAEILGRDISMAEVIEKFLAHFSEVLEMQLKPVENQLPAGGAGE